MPSSLIAIALALALTAAPAVPQPAAEPPLPEPAAAAEPGAGPRSEDVRYATGPLTLAAELLLPAAEGPVAGAVIVQGSGASDRSNAWARSIAEELVANGLAVLLTDKRGSGASGGDWRRVGFGELAADALAGARWLAARPEVDPGRVGLVGLSQGGWVAPVAAASRPADVAWVVTVSSAAVGFAEQTFAEMANTARQAGLGEAQVAEVLALHRAAGQYLLGGEWDAYALARERGLQQPWGAIAGGFPASDDDPIWAFLRRVASFDPLPYWIQLRQPVLAVFGEADEADNVPVTESVRRLGFVFGLSGHDDHEIVVVPGAGHALFAEAGGLHPGFTGALASWLAGHGLAAEAEDAPGEEGTPPPY